MVKKIKTFTSCVNKEELERIETEVNTFTSTHDVEDIIVNTPCNKYGVVIVYTVIYKEV